MGVRFAHIPKFAKRQQLGGQKRQRRIVDFFKNFGKALLGFKYAWDCLAYGVYYAVYGKGFVVF